MSNFSAREFKVKVRDWYTNFGPGHTTIGRYDVLDHDPSNPACICINNPETSGFWKFKTNLDEYDFVLMNEKELKVFLWKMWDFYAQRG